MSQSSSSRAVASRSPRPRSCSSQYPPPVGAAERKVYGVAEFNRRLAGYVGRVLDVWVEGEVAELRRNPAWATVFLTLKDARTGACLPATMQRGRFDRIEPPLAEGERVQANGGLQLYEARGELSFRATAIERVGAGDHAARLA